MHDRNRVLVVAVDADVRSLLGAVVRRPARRTTWRARLRLQAARV